MSNVSGQRHSLSLDDYEDAASHLVSHSVLRTYLRYSLDFSECFIKSRFSFMYPVDPISLGTSNIVASLEAESETGTVQDLDSGDVAKVASRCEPA